MTLSQADIDSLLGPQSAGSVESLLDTPTTGEDIANALQDPNFTPTQEQYQLFEDYNKTRQTDWLQSLLTAADTVVQTAGAAGKAAVTTGAAFNPKNYVEGLAQGTAQLYGLVAQSQDPDSALFKLNNLISGTGTLENRYGQFLEARQFNKDLDAYAKGDMSIMFRPEDLNPEFVQGVAMVADPTMFVPGVGQLLGAEKVAAKAVGKAAAVAGKGVQAISKPVERLSAAAGKFVTEATGISPEALRGAATTSGVLAATGVGPAIGAVGAVPFIAEAATDVGRALETAGAQAGRAPTRIGALEAVGAIPEANMRQRIIGTIGRYGGDAALRTALAGTAGTLEGAALGGALGYLSGGEEGAASGIGSGGVAGALGSLGARGLQTLTGSEAKAARLNDLTTYVDTLAPEKKAAYQSVQERFGTDTAANLMDLESLIKGTRGDIGVEILRGDEFQKRAGVTARGVVPDENAATPRILINVDAMPKVKGDSPIYTLGHELLHALAKTKQFQGDVTGFVETLTGAYVPNPDGTVRLVSEGQYSPAKVEQLFNDYVKQLPEDARANVISANPTASDRAVYVGEELAAEQVGRILSSQKPDAFLRGFGSTRQNFTDMLLLQEASRVGSKIGQLIERTFGITPTDSVLFPEVKNASPALDAALRRLLKARENIDEALLNADYQKSFKIDQKAISDPVAADYAVRGGFAERLPTGEVRLLTNGELLQRETRDVTALKQIIDGLPGAKIDINGEVVGDLSPEQLDAIKGSSVSSQMKQRYEMANRGINEGRALFVEYYPATEKVQDPTSKRWRTKYASRRVTFREMLMYNLLFSKENNAYVRAIDLTQVRKSLQRSIRPDGSVGGLWGNVGEFLGELNAYLTNLDRKENAIPSRKIFGPDKAEFFGNFMNSAEKGGSEFIHSFRLDRMGQMDPSDFKAKFSESAYKKMKDRFMPAGSVGEEQAWKSGAGFTILTSGNKFRLYGPEGKLLGIYDSAEQAQRKSNATQARIQSENDQLQYPTRDEVGQTAEAGNRNRALDRTQGREEGGQELGPVRQAGDVVIAPDSESFTISKSDIGRFMPASDKVRLEDYADRKIIALAADRMGIGEMSVGPTGAKRKLSVLGQGGRGFMNIFNGGGWAFSDEATASRFLKRLNADADADGNVIVGITVQSPINHLKNQTGQLAYVEAMQAAIDSRTITKRAADSQVAAMSSAIVNSEAQSIKQSARDKFRKINTFSDLKKAVNQKQLNFADMEPLLTQMQRKKLPITAKELEAAGISPADIARDIADPELADVPFGSVVALLGVNVKQSPERTGFHYSYPWTIHGEAIGYLDKFYNISDLSTERRIRNSRGEVTAQPLQTVMPVMDNIINTIKSKEGIPSAPSQRFMPSDAEYISAVEAGDTAKAQELVDQAAKAAGYTVGPVYHGSPVGGFTQFKDSASGLYFTDKESLAEGYTYYRKAWLSKGKSPTIYKTHIKLENPLIIDAGGARNNNIPFPGVEYKRTVFGNLPQNAISVEKAAFNAFNMGHDGLIVKNVMDGVTSDDKTKSTVFVVKNKEQAKSSEFVTKDNSGNIIPLSQRFQQGNADIRYMPEANPEDINALKLLPKPRRSLESAYMDGVRTRDQDPQYYDVPDYAGYDMARTAAFDLGRAGGERPRWVMAERIGKLPEGGRSQNFAEQKMERGVSVLRIVGESQSDIGTYEMFNPGEKRYVAGWMIGYGSDGEPLLVDAVDLGPVKSVPRLQPDPSIPGAYSMSGYRILPGKTKGKLRVYSPSGALVGVVGSVDDAQRMIQKKLQ